jgi:hypothetical protein
MMPFIKKSNWTVESIHEMILEGKSYTDIAEVYGISKQRIKQIALKHDLPRSVDVKRQKKAEKYFKKWGNRDTSDLYAVCREKFRNKKAVAKANGVEWTVEFGELDWPTHCPILEIEIDYFTEGGARENSPSFDRIDPTKGYITGNVKIVSWRANRIKNDGTAEEHEKIAQYLRDNTKI